MSAPPAEDAGARRVRLSQALATIDDWPVSEASAAVVGFDDGAGRTTQPPRLLASYGPWDDPYPLASVTKLLTTLAVLVAVEEGIVELDAPASPPGATVAHLLAHASGLGPDGEVLARPGARRIYSNAGFELLGTLVEGAAGMPFDDYFYDGVGAPLGLARTTIGGSAAHGGRSSLDDLVVVAQELVVPGLVHRHTVRQATTVAFPGLAGVLPGFGRQEPNDWGLGFEIRGAKQPHWTGTRNSPATFGHFGQSGTFLWVDPAASLALVVLTDRPFGPWAIEAWPALSDAVVLAALDG